MSEVEFVVSLRVGEYVLIQLSSKNIVLSHDSGTYIDMSMQEFNDKFTKFIKDNWQGDCEVLRGEFLNEYT